MKHWGQTLTALASLGLFACSGAGDGTEVDLGVDEAGIIGPSTPGGRNEVVQLYILAVNSSGQLVTRGCSGSYFAPRVVLTAAHCLQNAYLDQVFVYHGDDFAQDFSELTFGGNYFVPPAPGQPSHFAQADSYEQHPNWDPQLLHPDMGVVYLDRKLPFDPLPLSRNPLAANRQVTISGWGANSAPTPTTGAGGFVQRTGTTRTLGSPTVADYHADDPNPGMLNATVRSQVIKIDGRAPYANSCFGDSGGPILINDFGQTYIAGVSYFGGLSCLDYGLYVRLNPFLPFLDQAYKKGGQETLIPSFECVSPNAQGTLTAFFGYNNKNGVSVTVPYGAKNALARDTAGWRPTRFLPGQHRFAFSVDFTPGQTVSWTLSPENSPTTTVTVNQASKRCGEPERDLTECALWCRASQRAAGCADLPPFETCLGYCMDSATFVRDVFPACVDENSTANVCVAALSPAAENWDCYPGFGAFPLGCGAEFEAVNACIVASQ